MGKKNLIYSLLVAAVVIFIADYFSLLGFIKNPLDAIVIPLKRTIYSASILVKNFGDVIGKYPQLADLISKEQNLNQNNEELTFRLKILEEENTKLRQQLGVSTPRAYKLIASPVISVTRFMEIGAGESEGIKAGMIVVDGSTLVGKVVQTSLRRSKIMLPTDSEINIAAKSNRGTRGLVTGQFGTNIIFDKVLQKDLLLLGDVVVTTGESEFPPNLVIGTVVSINSPDVSPYKSAKIEAPIDYKTASTVFVISS